MDITDAPFPGGDIALLLGIVEFFAAHGNASFVGIAHARYAIQQSRLTGAGSAKQNGETSQRAEMDIEVERPLRIRKAFADADFEFGGDGLYRYLRQSTRRDDELHRHGATVQERRLTP